MAGKKPIKIHQRSKDNMDIEFFEEEEGYVFLIYVYDKKRVGVIDNASSKPYSKLSECLASGTIQFYNLKQVHG